jgi:hypothetical protein
MTKLEIDLMESYTSNALAQAAYVPTTGANTNLLSNADFATWAITDIVVNGGFETYTTTPGAPDSWSYYQDGTGGSAAKETTEKKAGSNSCKLTKSSTGSSHILITPSAVAYRNKTMIFGVWIKSANTTAGAVKILMTDSGTGAGWSQANYQNSGGWEFITLSRLTTADAGTFTILVAVASTATAVAYFDNVVCYEMVSPTSWSMGGTGAIQIREENIVRSGYSSKLTRVGNDCWFNQVLSIGSYAGQTVTVGAWVYATVANRVYLSIYDGVGSTNSSYHTGNSTWQWLQVTRTLSSSASLLSCSMYVVGGNTSGYMDNSFLISGGAFYDSTVDGLITLKAFSEATIKTQGSYALKGIASNVGSLNKTLTKTFSPTLDLTDVNKLSFDIYSNRTGANLKIGLADTSILSNSNLLDEDMSDITDWTDADNTGWSLQVTFDSKECMKLLFAVDAGAGAPKRTRDIGSFGNRTVFSMSAYFDAIGTEANEDYFELNLFNGTTRFWAAFCSDGFKINNGTSFIEVGTNILIQDTWQEYTFDLNWVTKTVDVYLAGVLQAAGLSFNLASATANGTIEVVQNGHTTADRCTYIDWMKIGDNFAGVTEVTPTIITADTWQKVVIDLTAVTNINKDAIYQLVVTPTNADADNTFYLDNFVIGQNIDVFGWVG